MSYTTSPSAYIQAISTSTQTATAPPNAAYIISYNTIITSSSVRLVDNTQITFDESGTYFISFSAVCDTTVGTPTINIWASKNGNNLPDTNTVAYVAANGNPVVMTVTLIESFAVGDYFELKMSSSAAGGIISGIAESAGPPAIPACPSIILTANKISE